MLWHYRFPSDTIKEVGDLGNVRGEPVFSVMAGGWFCEKSSWIGKVEDVKPVLLKKNRISTINHLEEKDFLPGWIVKQADFIRFDSSRVGYHLVLGYTLFVHCKLVEVWWMANKRSLCFIIAFHNSAKIKNWLTYQYPSSWPVFITMKKKLAGTWKKVIGYWPVQLNGNKFATGQILRKPVEVVKGRILAGWAQKSPERWT
jgi:hypothetical protein